MKTNMSLLLSVLFAAHTLVGCASTGSSNTKNLLAASGFHGKTPETQKQKELYAATEAYKVQRITANDKTFYVYKDEKSGIAWVGDESNYQEYKKLAVQQSIARQEYQAAEMRRDAAYGWYRAYGYHGYGAPGVSYGARR
jgi:hypothetical protein